MVLPLDYGKAQTSVGKESSAQKIPSLIRPGSQTYGSPSLPRL